MPTTDLYDDAKRLAAVAIKRGWIKPATQEVRVQKEYVEAQRQRAIDLARPAAIAKIAEWNAAHPVGTVVAHGRKITATHSKAWLFGATPMINLLGVSGGVPLRDVRAIV